MFLSNNNTECYSGYIKIDENFQIDEFSGQIDQILRKEHLDLNGTFIQIIEGLKKTIRFFFENEVLTAIKAKKICHLSFNRKNSILCLSVTPLSSGLTLISFVENPRSENLIEKTLPEKLKEIFSNNGFKHIEYQTCFEVKRESGVKYPVFLLVAQK